LFVILAAGVLDPEGQESIKSVVDPYGKDNLVTILGAPDADSAELYAETIVRGDPSWVGPLAGIAMELPVYHIMEPEIKEQVEPSLYKEYLELMEIALDVERITQALDRVRHRSG